MYVFARDVRIHTASYILFSILYFVCESPLLNKSIFLFFIFLVRITVPYRICTVPYLTVWNDLWEPGYGTVKTDFREGC